MYIVTVGADPCVRLECGNVTAHVDVHRADAGGRPYRCCQRQTLNTVKIK